MTQPQPGGPPDGVMAAAVLKLTDLAARVEQVEQSAEQRIGELAASCAEALAQVASLREEAGTLGGRADGIEARLAEVGALLARMSDQIDGLTVAAQDEPGQAAAAYRVNPARRGGRRAMTGAPTPPSGCGTGSTRCTGRYSATLGAMLGDCWDRHPLCLAYLDTLHEAWCLLYIPAA